LFNLVMGAALPIAEWGRRWDRGRLIVRYSRASDRVRALVWLEVVHGTLF
jgi:hypothetical protein